MQCFFRDSRRLFPVDEKLAVLLVRRGAPQDRDPRGLCDGRPSSNSWPARSIWVTISLRPTLLWPIADAVSVALQGWQSHQREGRTRRRTFNHVEGIGFYRGPRPPPRVSRTHLAAAQDQHVIREGDQGCACPSEHRGDRGHFSRSNSQMRCTGPCSSRRRHAIYRRSTPPIFPALSGSLRRTEWVWSAVRYPHGVVHTASATR